MVWQGVKPRQASNGSLIRVPHCLLRTIVQYMLGWAATNVDPYCPAVREGVFERCMGTLALSINNRRVAAHWALIGAQRRK